MNRVKSIVAWVLQVLLAALFAIQAFVKLTSSPAWVLRFRAWGYPDHFYLAVGAAELLAAIALLIGAIALLIPRLAKFPMFSRFGALLLIVIMVGATATHVVHHERQAMTTSVLLVLLMIVLYLRRGSAKPTSG